MNVVIVDDEELAIEVLERMLIHQEEINIIGKYTDPSLALSEIKKMEVDAVFLDLEMGSLHGLQFAELLYNEARSISVIFVTAYSQYALEAFGLNAVDYLLKPISKARLHKTIDKLKKELSISQLHNISADFLEKKLYVHTLGMYWMADSKGSIPIKWRTKKVKELFAFLMHHKEHPVHRTLIMEELWPDAFVDKGAALLHTTVYQLRKMLKEMGYENAIQYGNEQYIMEINVESDIQFFQDLIRMTKSSQSEIRNMIALYEGDYFEQEEYSWVIYDQQKIKKAFLQQMENYVITLAMESPKDEFLESCLIKMIQIDVYNDDYVYQLMQFYERTTSNRKLIEVYHDYQIRLKEELGLNIPFKLLKLYSKVVKGVE